MIETTRQWRAALADAIAAGKRTPADLVSVPPPEGYAEAGITLRRLADNLEHDQAPLPPAACETLRLPPGARFGDAVRVLRELWG